MIIRGLSIEDLEAIEKIYSKFFSNEFTLNEFLDAHLLYGFVAVNDFNEIVCAGGVRTIAEAVLLTDKSFSVRDRREALYKILQASMQVSKNLNYTELHAFIQDKTWEKHLERVGFRQTKGTALVLPL